MAVRERNMALERIRDRLGNNLARVNTRWLGLALALGIGVVTGVAVARRGRRQGTSSLEADVRALMGRLDALSRDLGNRAQGQLAEARARVRDERVSDEVLAQRIRSEIGHCVSHPQSIVVQAHQGRVVLSGPILAHEVGALLACVNKVPGVDLVDNHLEIHEQAGSIPSLRRG